MKKTEIKRIVEKTCWGSLAFCCSLEKDCSYRDEVIKEIGLKKKDYNKLKKEFDEKLFELIN